MKKIILAFLLIHTIASRADSTVVACGNKEYQKADEQLSSVVKGLKKSKKPWMELQSVFKVWEPCKNKFQDEDFIDAIAELTVTRWDKVSDLSEVKKKSPTFYSYIKSSLGNDTVGLERSKRIAALAKGSCPQAIVEICKDIELSVSAEN